jgi:DNA-directed RNA polymerase subunit RPC12/RpoP
MSGRIVLRLDAGLGWTKPVFVAGCGACGAELARRTDQAAATRAAGRTRCPACGSRTARRLPGTTSPATDLDLTRGLRGAPARQRRPLDHHPQPSQGGMPPATRPHPRSRSLGSSGRSPVMARRSLWQIDMGDGTWAVCCMACRLALFRGPKPTADRVFAGHRCEPVVPLARPRRRRRPA